MAFTLKNGRTLTDEDIEKLAEQIDRGSLPGEWTGDIVVGRPRLSSEPLDILSFKIPHSLALEIGNAVKKYGGNRSAFLRDAALEKAKAVLAQ